MIKRVNAWALAITFFLPLQLSFLVTAQTRLPAILSDNMCLQQMTEVKIWGWDTPGQEVKISPSWNEKEVSTKTNGEGQWMAMVSTLKQEAPTILMCRVVQKYRLQMY